MLKPRAFHTLTGFALTLTLLTTTLPIQGTAAPGPGIIIYDISTPTITPNPVKNGEWADVSFTLSIYNRDDCAQVFVTENVPACAYVLAWRISLNGEWLREGSTRLAEGHAAYSPQLEPYPDTYFEVTERVRVDAAPGEHEVVVMANWVAGVPVSRYGSGDFRAHAWPCFLEDHIDLRPTIGCGSSKSAGWLTAPSTILEVEPSRNALQFDLRGMH